METNELTHFQHITIAEMEILEKRISKIFKSYQNIPLEFRQSISKENEVLLSDLRINIELSMAYVKIVNAKLLAIISNYNTTNSI
jgi:hypothetical protein